LTQNFLSLFLSEQGSFGSPLSSVFLFLLAVVPAETDQNVEVEAGSDKATEANGEPQQRERKPKMDWLSTFLQTAAIVLFVYGLTSANIKGW